MTKLILKSTSVAAALILAACTGSTDPTTANIFDNIKNLDSGEYDNQIKATEAEANRIAADNKRRQANISSLKNQKAANSATVNRLRGQVASVGAQISKARAAVAGNAAKTAQLNRLQTQLSAVNADINNGVSTSVANAELGRIRSAVRALAG